MKQMTALLLVLALTGCASEYVRQTQAEMVEICNRYGWESGQCQYAQGVTLQLQADTAAQQRAWAGAAAATMMMPRVGNPSTGTTCTRFGNQLSCR